MADNPFLKRLTLGGTLASADLEVLRELFIQKYPVAKGEDIIAQDEAPTAVRLVASGLASRYKVLENGRRSIATLMIPGDFCDLHGAVLGRMDHSIGAVTDCEMVAIPRSTILTLTSNHPRIARALWWATLVDEAVLREWLVNIGQRPAIKRVAHLFCELRVRLEVVGLASEGRYDLPLTQNDLADICGLSPVHINRSLQALRADRLLEFRQSTVKIHDVVRLEKYAGFDPAYLHLDGVSLRSHV